MRGGCLRRPAAGYHSPMRYKLAYGAGFATGYYFGARAGRQRYDEINRQLRKLRRSPKVEAVADKAKSVLDEGVDKAKAVVGESVDKAKSVVTRKSNGSAGGTDGSPNGTNTVPNPVPGIEQTIATAAGVPTTPYSSSK